MVDFSFTGSNIQQQPPAEVAKQASETYQKLKSVNIKPSSEADKLVKEVKIEPKKEKGKTFSNKIGTVVDEANFSEFAKLKEKELFPDIEEVTDAKEEHKEVEKESLQEAVTKVNEVIKNIDKEIKFSIYEETKNLMVSVIDANTNEVVKTIPPEKLLELRAKFQEAIGMFFDLDT